MDFLKISRFIEKFKIERKGEGQVNDSVNKNEFFNSICFEEDPFVDEVPEKMFVFDLDGNEVDS